MIWLLLFLVLGCLAAVVFLWGRETLRALADIRADSPADRRIRRS